MCEDHRHVGAVVVEERTPLVEASREPDKLTEATQSIEDLVQRFGHDVVQKALEAGADPANLDGTAAAASDKVGELKAKFGEEIVGKAIESTKPKRLSDRRKEME